MTKHTPGPWHWTPNSRVIESVTHGNIGLLNLARDDAETAANAALIACAPELLAAVEKAASECGGCDGDGRQIVTFNDRNAEHDPCEACADLRALLARAKGE